MGGVGLQASIVCLPDHGAAFTPSHVFRPGKQNLAIAVDRQRRVFSIHACAGRGCISTDVVSAWIDPSEIDLLLRFPRRENIFPALCQGRGTHHARPDIPMGYIRAVKRNAAVGGRQQVHVPIHHLSRRPKHHVHGSIRGRERAASATAANAGGFAISDLFACESLSAIGGARHPDAPVRFVLAVRGLSVPEDVNVIAGIGGNTRPVGSP